MATRLPIIVVCVAFSGWLYGQSDTLTLSSGGSSSGSMTVNIMLNSPAGSEPAAVQWVLGFSSADVYSASATAGPSATSAGKSIVCIPDYGSYTCVASGTNSNIITNGLVASVTLNLAPGVTSEPVTFGGTLGVDPRGTSLAIASVGGAVGGGGGGGMSGPPVSSLSCTPSSLILGGTTLCTVTLASAAPVGGTVVALSTSGDSVAVGGSVTVVAGALSATFIATAAFSGGATLSATSGGVSASVAVSVASGPTSLSSVACIPAAVAGGDHSACAITLSGPAPAGGAAVSVSSSNSLVTVPMTVTVPSGANSVTLTAKTSSVSSSQTATITASYNGVSQNTNLTVAPPVPLSGISCALPSVSGTPIMSSVSTATCTVSLARASTVFESFNLSSSTVALSVPSSVSVPAGSTSATFTATSGTIGSSSVSVTLTANGYGVTKTVTFKLVVLVSSLTCTPSAIPPSSSGTCKVALSQTVSSPVTVSIGDSDTRLSVPATATVPAGSASVNFAGTDGAIDYEVITVTAALNGLSTTATVSIGIVPLASLACSPTSLTAGASSTCTFTLAGPAMAGGETVSVSSSSTKLSAPSTVAVAAGAKSGGFTVKALSGYAGPVTVTARVVGTKAYTATISSASRRGPGSVKPEPVTSLPQRLSCAPKFVQAGSTVSCQLQLTSTDPSGVAAAVISASHPSIQVPSRVQSRPHQTTLSFEAYVDPAASTQTVTIQAAAGESIAEEHLSVQAGGKPVLSVPGKQFVTIGSKLRFQVGAASGSGEVGLSARSLPAGGRFDAATGVLEWTPGGASKERVTFAATDGSGSSVSAEVAIEAGDGSPVLDSLRNAASGSTEAVCSSGGLATVRGGWLAEGDTRVLVNGAQAPVVQASPTQVTFVCPAALVGTALAVAVETVKGRSAELSTEMRDAALGIFTVDGSGSGSAASMLDSGRFAIPRDARNAGEPAQAGDVLRIAVTGLAADADPGLVAVQVADISVPAEWIRAVGTGMTEIGVAVPAATPVGDSVPLVVQRRLPDGRVVVSQIVTGAFEAVQQ